MSADCLRRRGVVVAAGLLVLTGCASSSADHAARQARLHKMLQQLRAEPPLDQPLRMIHGQMPDYPAGLRRSDITGSVALRVRVDSDGHVSEWRVLGSPPEPLLHNTVLYVRHWRFDPPKRAGQPTAVWFTFEWVYRLED